jgi:hypothetical protein
MCRKAIVKRIEYCHQMMRRHPKTYKLLYTQEIAGLNLLHEKLDSILNAI